MFLLWRCGFNKVTIPQSWLLVTVELGTDKKSWSPRGLDHRWVRERDKTWGCNGNMGFVDRAPSEQGRQGEKKRCEVSQGERKKERKRSPPTATRNYQRKSQRREDLLERVDYLDSWDE